MNFECNPKKVIKGGFGPPLYGKPPKKGLGPYYSPIPGYMYELTSDARLGPVYWINRKREEDEKNQSGGPKTYGPPYYISNYRAIAKNEMEFVTPPPSPPAVPFTPTVWVPEGIKVDTTFVKLNKDLTWEEQRKMKDDADESKKANVAAMHAREMSNQKENVRPKGSMFSMEVEEVERKPVYTGTGYKAYAMDDYIDSEGRFHRQFDVELEDLDEAAQSFTERYDGTMHNDAFTQAWLNDQTKIERFKFENSDFLRKMEEALMAESDDDGGSISSYNPTPESTPDLSSQFEVGQAFGGPGPGPVNKPDRLHRSLSESSLVIEKPSSEFGERDVSYQGAPGDRSAFNSRTGRSATDLEMAMLQYPIKSENPNENYYPAETHPFTNDYNMLASANIEQWGLKSDPQVKFPPVKHKGYEKKPGKLTTDVEFDEYETHW